MRTHDRALLERDYVISHEDSSRAKAREISLAGFK
jgi:hypothetical protein